MYSPRMSFLNLVTVPKRFWHLRLVVLEKEIGVFKIWKAKQCKWRYLHDYFPSILYRHIYGEAEARMAEDAVGEVVPIMLHTKEEGFLGILRRIVR